MKTKRLVLSGLCGRSKTVGAVLTTAFLRREEMRSHSGRIVGLALIMSVAIALGRAPTAAAQTPVFCGISSSFDGEQMILTGDLLNCAGPAVTITHNNVHLDMQGFTIDGDGTGIGIHLIDPTGAFSPCGPLTGPSGFHINGGTVQDFEHGILMCRSDTAHINGMTVTSNVSTGITISRASTGGNSGPSDHKINGSTLSFNGSGGGGDGGLVVISASGNTIHTMNIHENDRFGVLFRFAGNNTISSSEIHDNGSIGVYADRAGANKVRSNTISGGAVGIFIDPGGPGAIVQGNTVTNTNIGIQIRDLRNGVLRGNITNNNRDGILVLRNLRDSLVRSNTANNNVRFGINIRTSSNNLLQGNTALGNGNTDLLDNNLSLAPLPCNNTWKNNTFVTKQDPGGCIQ